MLPSAPLPWVSSQMTTPDVAHRGVLAVVAAGEVVAAIAASAAAQAIAALSRLEKARPGMASPLRSRATARDDGDRLAGPLARRVCPGGVEGSSTPRYARLDGREEPLHERRNRGVHDWQRGRVQ